MVGQSGHSGEALYNILPATTAVQNNHARWGPPCVNPVCETALSLILR
jgi:hypothetical protein